MGPRRKKAETEKFLFVNTTDDLRQTRTQHRHRVHSHVSQYRWHLNREARPEAQASNANATKDETPANQFSSHQVKEQPDTRMLATAGLTNLLSNASMEPILSYSDDFYHTHQVQDAMSYGAHIVVQKTTRRLVPIYLTWLVAFRTMWPGLLLQENTGITWVPAATADPVLFSAFMYGVVVHMQSRLIDATLSDHHQQAAWQINNETIRRLYRSLSDQARASSDGAIFAVLTLAYSAQLRSGPLNPDPQPRRPLQDLQWLTVYSSLDTNSVHVQGLIALLELKGGLEQIPLPRLAPLLSYLCMLRSSRSLQQPGLPFFPLSEEHLKMESIKYAHYDFQNNELLAKMPPRMRHIIGRMHYYNQLIACYLAGSIETPHMAIFADQRNWIQRSLLELPYFDEVVVEPDGPFSRFEHEAVRASLLFYSYLVIFPIPFAYGPYDRLRQLLTGILMDEGAQNLPQPFLLWAVSLGAISEIQILGHLQDSQQWFLNMLKELILKMGMSNWNDYKSVVQSVMWQDSVLDPFMQRIWLAHILSV
ncbi:conserved hypothetical protein [Talaromyces stipitatus ATCC 10500]|uniref:Uncharacterized protein n=1 Tax=Talaromyces stipitatus (strain ATCC 10500 / CBS 375.48 / QM 6759 / NRRL 1006) TaxID=441959 RepID=B8MU87_TALSN|nr:uncharacterized protein TSTA_107820 [Talaromyces stipitatus ATCC 10500]EED11591.1 conserved hypothetical protein [Talaromyces stipitatus ATCC 10500]